MGGLDKGDPGGGDSLVITGRLHGGVNLSRSGLGAGTLSGFDQEVGKQSYRKMHMPRWLQTL